MSLHLKQNNLIIIMRLKVYIKQNGYSYKSFADAFGTHYRNVESWAKGDRLPRWAEAKKLFEFTNYEVNGHDLYEEQIQRKEANLQRDKI